MNIACCLWYLNSERQRRAGVGREHTKHGSSPTRLGLFLSTTKVTTTLMISWICSKSIGVCIVCVFQNFSNFSFVDFLFLINGQSRPNCCIPFFSLPFRSSWLPFKLLVVSINSLVLNYFPYSSSNC